MWDFRCVVYGENSNEEEELGKPRRKRRRNGGGRNRSTLEDSWFVSKVKSLYTQNLKMPYNINFPFLTFSFIPSTPDGFSFLYFEVFFFLFFTEVFTSFSKPPRKLGTREMKYHAKVFFFIFLKEFFLISFFLSSVDETKDFLGTEWEHEEKGK